MRSAGDLVARMMYGKSMKLKDAKEYVAKKLGVTTLDLIDDEGKPMLIEEERRVGARLRERDGVLERHVVEALAEVLA